MNSSLRDQLLSLGLVSEKQARQVTQQEQQKQFRDRSRSNPKPAPGPTPAVSQAQAAKLARDQELNRRRQEKAQRRARLAEIDQIVAQNRLPRLETDDHYSFIDGKKIRRMSVDVQRRDQLMRGELAIVRYRGHYAVVPAAIAELIRERDQHMVVPHLQSEPSIQQDDAYKDYVVPDDLMW
jgi:uncharacterized protein